MKEANKLKERFLVVGEEIFSWMRSFARRRTNFLKLLVRRGCSGT